ncbi:MAG TPA: FAD-dependent oxidoreductase [Trebonia sp.]|jgi:D-amino-acid oxidase|nr:FAD-dependent oxidoreductase [Trebonia sp.]
MTHVDAVVAGAGVAGLTTAISLAEAGLSTRIVTAAPPDRTTSAAAGAIWGPVRCGPPDRTHGWARTGLAVLSALADEPAAAIRQVSGVEVAAKPASPPGWMDLLPDMRLLGSDELPAGFTAGWRYTAPVVTMPLYLEYLRSRYAAVGGTISIAPPLTSLRSVPDAPVVVNCTGIGARDLVPDPAVFPVRGQVVVVENPGIDEFYIDHTLHGDDYVYMFPHGDVVLLGGTAAEHDWDRQPRENVAERILRDCSAVHPRLRGARIVTQRVGLRPCRPEVRLESEALPGGRTLWHNYGHGGAGVTLSWGCAREITESVLAGEDPAA